MTITDAAPPRAAADALKDAIDAHLTACERSTGEGDPGVQRTYEALHRASVAYDDALYDAYDEVTPWQYAEAPVVEVEGGVEADALTRFSLLVRRDYAVDDLGALLAAGRSAYTEVWPDDPAEAAVADVSTPGRAVYQLIHAHGLDGLAERAEASGLAPFGGTVWVQATDEDDDTLEADDPFEIVDPDALVYRLDEVYEDD